MASPGSAMSDQSAKTADHLASMTAAILENLALNKENCTRFYRAELRANAAASSALVSRETETETAAAVDGPPSEPETDPREKFLKWNALEFPAQVGFGHAKKTVIKGRGLPSSTFQLNLSRFNNTSLCPHV